MKWNKAKQGFKEQLAYKIGREIERQTRPLTHHWTIGDGRKYETKKQAEVMSYINANGQLFLDTVLSSPKVARAVDELIEKGIIKSVESEQEYVLKFEVL